MSKQDIHKKLGELLESVPDKTRLEILMQMQMAETQGNGKISLSKKLIEMMKKK